MPRNQRHHITTWKCWEAAAHIAKAAHLILFQMRFLLGAGLVTEDQGSILRIQWGVEEANMVAGTCHPSTKETDTRRSLRFPDRAACLQVVGSWPVEDPASRKGR